MPRSAVKTISAHSPRKKGIFSPWLCNGVRRRWMRMLFVLLLIFEAALFFVDLDYYHLDTRQILLRALILCSGLVTLALLYAIAQVMKVGRDIGLWAMIFLAMNIPWLIFLRQGDATAFFPCAVALAALGYLLCMRESRFGWPMLAAGGIAMLFCNQPIGLGMLLGIGVHAAWWVRQQSQLTQLAWAAVSIAVGGITLHPILQLAASEGGFWAGVSLHILAIFSWLLPLLALPLLALTVGHEMGRHWRVHREVSLFALVVGGVVLMGGLCSHQTHIANIVSIAPIAAIWMAIGLDRLQGRTTPWVWAPVGVILVLTTAPQILVNWTVRMVQLPARISNPHIADQLQEPDMKMIVPLYAYLREGTSEE